MPRSESRAIGSGAPGPRHRGRLGAPGAAVAAVGIIGLFAGPAGAWAVAGVGLCVVLLGTAAAVTWQQHRSGARP